MKFSQMLKAMLPKVNLKIQIMRLLSLGDTRMIMSWSTLIYGTIRFGEDSTTGVGDSITGAGDSMILGCMEALVPIGTDLSGEIAFGDSITGIGAGDSTTPGYGKVDSIMEFGAIVFGGIIGSKIIDTAEA